MLGNIRVVLVEPSHPGNIGASARAMKTMGIDKLYLVKPRKFPHPEANALASGAENILSAAKVVDNVDEAISDCHLVVGSSARKRTMQIPLLESSKFARQVFKRVGDQKVALVFGREHAGLTNDELYRCHYHVMIPTDTAYSSLNLSQAVQIICYELRQYYLSLREQKMPLVSGESTATTGEVEGLYQHLEETLVNIDFMNRTQPKKLMPKIRRLFNRASLQQEEINILRGILTAMGKQAVEKVGKDES